MGNESAQRGSNLAQALMPQAFWTALNNQNLGDMSPPQWSIVVNDSGVQCSIFFENGDHATSSKSSNSSGLLHAVSPLVKNGFTDNTQTVKSPDDSFDKMEDDVEEINHSSPIKMPEEDVRITPPNIPHPTPNVSGIPNLPLLQQFLGQQIAAAAAAAGNGNGHTPPCEQGEKPTPGDLMLISQENRRRLMNLREEATANRLSVTAFIRRGALLYFDSDELALNRLHTLDQKRLNALELETKYYFGDIPQQLFRRTIAIQQSQIRSKKSNANENRVRFRPTNFNFNFNPNNLVTGLTSQPTLTNVPALQMATAAATALKLEP